MSRYMKESWLSSKKPTAKMNSGGTEMGRKVLRDVGNLRIGNYQELSNIKSKIHHNIPIGKTCTSSQFSGKTGENRTGTRIDHENSLILQKNKLPKNVTSRKSVGPRLLNSISVEEDLCSKFQKVTLNEATCSQNQRDRVNKEDNEESYKRFKCNFYLNKTYVEDIYNHLLHLEDLFTIKSDFLRNTLVTPRIRAVLIDWMMDVQLIFKMSNESFQLSIYLVDNYLNKHRNTGKEDLQVLAIACLHLAGKYDLVHPPHLKDFLSATENVCSRKDVLKMEFKVFKTVDMNLNKPPITCFLRRYGIVVNTDRIHYCCSKFFVDAILLNYPICHHKSSIIAVAATYLSLCLKNGGLSSAIWSKELSKHSKYNILDIKPLVKSLIPFIMELPGKSYSNGIFEKYSMLHLEKVKEKVYSTKNIKILEEVLNDLTLKETVTSKNLLKR